MSCAASLVGRRRPWCGTGCPPTAAWPCGLGSTVSGTGWWWSHCPAMHPTSTRSRRCGPASRAWSWPTWPARPSTTSSRRPNAASSGSAPPTTWPTRSCGIAACLCGERRSCHRNTRTSLVPLDAHLDLYREVRAGAEAGGVAMDLHRTDLALFDIDAPQRTLTCRFVEVKCYAGTSGLGDYPALKERIQVQLGRSATVLATHFDPTGPARPDRAVKNLQLANLLRFYLHRGQRHKVITPAAVREARWLLDRLDE